MKINYGTAILAINKQAKFVLTNEDLSTVIWLPDHTGVTPTTEEIQAKFDELQAQAPTKEVEKQRRLMYQRQADPLFFKWQAGEATQEEWIAKRQEIKDLLPYP